jgi:hypothetical protein
MTNSVSAASLSQVKAGRLGWREMITVSMKYKQDLVQDPAVGAMAAVSKVMTCSEDVQR